MARKRAIAPLKKTAMATTQKKQTASAAAAPTPRRSTRSTRGTATQQPVYTEPDSSDDEDHQPPATKGKAKVSAQPEQDEPTEGSPAPRYNTRYKQAQLSEQSQDADDVEEIPRGDEYPLYKDDLPNAFNGAVDPTLDFISKAPNEVIDNILSYLVLDHDPDRGVKIKAGTYKPVSHVLLSMAAMSRLFYHATEGFARRYRTKNKLDLPEPGVYWPQHPEILARLVARRESDEGKERNKRRSVRIASALKPETREVYRKALCDKMKDWCAVCHLPGGRLGRLANQVSVCEDCERSAFGIILNLTDALKRFDLRDYMLVKSRTPGPRAKLLNLPAISYGTEHKPMGFPIFNTVTVFSFRRSDVEMIAKLVHGDVKQHMQQKEAERDLRSERARARRVKAFKINYHQEELEKTTGAANRSHIKRLKELLALNPDDGDDDDDDGYGEMGCHKHFCYHDIGLCGDCGDVQGYNHEWCLQCETVRVHRRYDQYYSKAAGSGAGT